MSHFCLLGIQMKEWPNTYKDTYAHTLIFLYLFMRVVIDNVRLSRFTLSFGLGFKDQSTRTDSESDMFNVFRIFW